MSKKNDATPLAQKQDFARAVLKEPSYTIAGAKAALDKAWKGEG